MKDPSKKLGPLIDSLREKLGDGLISVVLFGSVARGDDGPASDVDVFVLAQELPENPFDRQMFLRGLLPKGLGGVSIVAKTKQEFERRLLSLYLDIATDGIILFDTDGYMEAKLREVREIIEASGLRRVMRRGERIWDWEERPKGRWKVEWKRNGI